MSSAVNSDATSAEGTRTKYTSLESATRERKLALPIHQQQQEKGRKFGSKEMGEGKKEEGADANSGGKGSPVSPMTHPEGRGQGGMKKRGRPDRSSRDLRNCFRRNRGRGKFTCPGIDPEKGRPRKKIKKKKNDFTP